MIVKQISKPDNIHSSISKEVSLATGTMTQSQTEMLGRFHLALLFPREWINVGPQLLSACADPDFAKEAYYSLEGGEGGKERIGLSIRFAEHAKRIMRNISDDTVIESETSESVMVRFTLTDLESNTPTSETFRVSKRIVVDHVSDDTIVLEEIKTAKGDKRYLVPASDDQISAAINARKARIRRALILSNIPADIKTACLNRCLEVTFDQDKKDPGAALKEVLTLFASIGIDAAGIKEFLGKPAQQATEKELQELRGVFTRVREGASTWREAVESRKATKTAMAKFVADKQKTKEAKTKDKPAATDAPARRGRKPKNGDGAPAGQGSSTQEQSGSEQEKEETVEPPAPKPRVSRRGDDEEEESNTEDAPDSSAS